MPQKMRHLPETNHSFKYLIFNYPIQPYPLSPNLWPFVKYMRQIASPATTAHRRKHTRLSYSNLRHTHRPRPSQTPPFSAFLRLSAAAVAAVALPPRRPTRPTCPRCPCAPCRPTPTHAVSATWNEYRHLHRSFSIARTHLPACVIGVIDRSRCASIIFFGLADFAIYT